MKMAKMPRPIRRSDGKKNVRPGVRRHGVRKYKFPKSKWFGLIDADIGRYLMRKLAKKNILAEFDTVPAEGVRALSKKEIMKKFNISEMRFDARARRIRPVIEAYFQQKMTEVLLSIGQATREKLEREGKLGAKRKK